MLLEHIAILELLQRLELLHAQVEIIVLLGPMHRFHVQQENTAMLQV